MHNNKNVCCINTLLTCRHKQSAKTFCISNMNLLNYYPTSNSRKHYTPKRQKKALYNPRQNSNKCTNSPPLPPTNVKVTHKICHELLIGINISLYSLPGIWHYRPFTTLWSVCYSMLYERPGANVGTYKQTARAVTSHTPILDPPNGHRGNQSPLSSPPPQSPTINISPFFAKKIITIQEN